MRHLLAVHGRYSAAFVDDLLGPQFFFRDGSEEFDVVEFRYRDKLRLILAACICNYERPN
jgi:hypothetical protein